MKRKSKLEIVNGIYVVHKGNLPFKKQPRYKIVEILKSKQNERV
jgi:hypothetical protein